MSIKHQETLFAGIGQSPGCDPKSSKRSSGLFSFFKWFRPSASRESISQELTPTSSCDSLNSITSTGTIASFSFVSPSEYKASVPEKSIALGPETDTYRARLKQRDKRRENDKDLTLRKKYNLFFNRDTLLKSKKNLKTDNSKSLPLMTRKTMELEEDKAHRRANSESSKLKKAGAYCHVKGKRKAPPPPVNKSISEGNSTLSLRRKKRLAPKPPATVIPEKIINCLENADKYGTIEYVDVDIVANDSLKLDHGILKSTKEYNDTQKSIEANKSPRASYIEPPVSPRPWYKRNLSRDSGSIFKKEKDATKSENKYEAINCFSEVQYNKNSNASELNVEESKSAKKKQDKRKSGIAFLTNISELDREASEIIKNEHKNDNTEMDPPPFMRPRAEPEKSNTDSWISPKRRSARDLIAKFNAITNVTKVTVNSAFFGSKESSAFQKEHLKRDYFGEQTGINEEPSKQIKTDVLKIPIKKTEHSKSVSPDENKKHLLMKSESAIITSDKDYNKKTVKIDKRSWYCPKCSLENDYWRIICYVCSTIKPYFDDLSSPPVKNTTPEKNLTPTPEIKQFPSSSTSDDSNHAKHQNEIPFFEKHLERSKTQIGFSALEKYNQKQEKKSISIVEPPKLSPTDKNEERERLKKMLIEMKNSLPNRRGMSSRGKIEEVNTEPLQTNWSKNDNKTTPKIEQENEKGITQQKEKIAELLIKTTETIYENIKVKKTENPKPIKISSSAQTNALARKHDIISPSKSIEKQEVNKNFQLMRPKDFANIYNEKTEKPDQHIYANLLENSDLFVNMPVKFSEIKNTVANNTDTLEINRLLKRLETAIARGELSEASNLARELALLKINCCVVRQKSIPDDEDKKTGFSVNMYVEDKISHRGPFPIVVSENQTVKQLKVQVENEFQIPAMVQRWILGKQLATDDNACLNDFQLTAEGCSIFLYLVAPINDNKVEKTNKQDVINTDIQNQSTIIEQSNSDRSNQETFKEQNFTKTESTGASTSKQINYPDIKETAASTSYINKTEFLKDSLKLTPKQTTDEEVDDYDSSTLKPKWECIMCTFLNSQDTNVCAICSTIRKLKMSNVDNQDKPKEAEILETDNKKDEHYLQLLNLDNADLVENTKIFECLICLTEIQPHEGVVLRECLHQFCKPCLSYTIEFTDEAEVKCPYRDNDYSCDISLQDREIKALITPVLYEQFLAKSVAQAENKIDKSFHCKTPDCPGWCIFEDNVNEFKCPVCQKTNCLTCQAIHAGLNCKQYQEQINDSIADEGTRRTKEMLEDMVNKGEAIKCPTCQVILMKKWGCDWLRCSMCKTEICWVTRGPRWGPAGKGDTSGGCQCGVNGIKCHPQCNYCH